jgi:hypothetical protein
MQFGSFQCAFDDNLRVSDVFIELLLRTCRECTPSSHPFANRAVRASGCSCGSFYPLVVALVMGLNQRGLTYVYLILLVQIFQMLKEILFATLQ